MNKKNKKYHRRPTRLRTHDYSVSGYYFVTTCVWGHKCVFGYIRNGNPSLHSAFVKDDRTIPEYLNPESLRFRDFASSALISNFSCLDFYTQHHQMRKINTIH